MMNMKDLMQARDRGYILPTIVIISFVTLVMIISLLVVAGSTFRGAYKDHYQLVAEEAAEAGVEYATACLQLNNRFQTWGPAASTQNLSPSADCNGANSYASNKYITNANGVRSYFDVGNLDFKLEYGVQISSNGYAEVLNSAGNVIKTYRSTIKKVITWPTNYTGQLSASGTYRTCAVVSGSAYCWGRNAYGQLGNGVSAGGDINLPSPSVDTTVPVKVFQAPGVLGGKTIIDIFTAQYHTCVLTSEGKVYCWGQNNDGQLGDGTVIYKDKPVEVGGALASKTVTDIGGTRNTSCAIAEGKIYCWGAANTGMTGIGQLPAAALPGGKLKTPTLVVTGTNPPDLPSSYVATQLSTEGSRGGTMCALANGKAYCWGESNAGSLGNGTIGAGTMVFQPTKVDDSGVLAGKTITNISQDGSSAGFYSHVCVTASGKVYCWGENAAGELGDGTNTNRSRPVAVDTSGVLAGKVIDEVRVGMLHTCARSGGAVYCWGSNRYGSVGDGSSFFTVGTTPRVHLSPRAVLTDPLKLTGTNVISIGAGSNRSCAIVNDGRTFCWGRNDMGQVGDGTLTDRNTPTESLFLRPVGNRYIF